MTPSAFMTAPVYQLATTARAARSQRGALQKSGTPARVQERAGGASRSSFVITAAAAAEEVGERTEAAEVDDEEDLKQYKDRDQWYVARFVADDAPDWNPATFLRSRQVTPGLRSVVVEAEISREKVPLRNAYKNVGQKASIRVNSGPNRELTVSSPPFPLQLNQDALFKARGDIFAGEIKMFKEIETVVAEIHLLVTEKEAEEVYNMTEGDLLEIGPFVGNGIDVRPMQSIYQFPTLVIFAEGKGIATAKALIETSNDANGLDLNFRQDVRLYYRAPNRDSLCFKDCYEDWETRHNCKVVYGTRDSFMELFDNDDSLMYEPETTAALVLTGGDEEAEAAALEVCKEAEISVITKDTEERAATEFLAQVNEGQI